MRLKSHLIAIAISIFSLAVPSTFFLTSLDGTTGLAWSLVSLFGVITAPGLAFALFLRKWAKNISDDMSLSLSLVISISWVLFIYTWQSNQGLTIQHNSILWSTVGLSLLFTLLGILPNGKKIVASEPLKNKVPMLISVAFLSISLVSSLNYILEVEESYEKADSSYNAFSLVRQTPETITVRVTNPSEETARLSVNLFSRELDAPPFTFTDIVSSGDTEVTFALPYSDLEECVKYEFGYSINSSSVEYFADGIVIGNSYCRPEKVRSPALPTDRDKLLDYIFSEGFK